MTRKSVTRPQMTTRAAKSAEGPSGHKKDELPTVHKRVKLSRRL
jgi:hypothetical protein